MAKLIDSIGILRVELGTPVCENIAYTCGKQQFKSWCSKIKTKIQLA